MTPYIQALRAITFVVFRNLFKPVAWVAGGIIVALIILTIILAVNYSGWWLLMLIVLIPISLIALAVGMALWFISGRMEPRKLSREETATINGFSGKITRIAEARATPIPLIVFLVAKDVIRGRKSSYVEDLLNDSTGLKSDFTQITDMFRPDPQAPMQVEATRLN